MGGILETQRSLDRALEDLANKRDKLPPNHPQRRALEEMIQRLEAEIARRRAAAPDQCG